MANYRRPRIDGACIYFTVNLADRGSDLLVREIDRLRWAVGATRRDMPFGVAAWVVLPDHMHCIWRLPDADRDFPTRWRLIKSRFSKDLPKGRLRPSHLSRNERGIWQRRYWEHHIRGQRDLDAHLDYCRWNPVKHGLVTRPEDWPYSSFTANRQVA